MRESWQIFGLWYLPEMFHALQINNSLKPRSGVRELAPFCVTGPCNFDEYISSYEKIKIWFKLIGTSNVRIDCLKQKFEKNN